MKKITNKSGRIFEFENYLFLSSPLLISSMTWVFMYDHSRVLIQIKIENAGVKIAIKWNGIHNLKIIIKINEQT